jgi:hypothetical protein
MAVEHARPDLAAHQEVVRMDSRRVVKELIELLGGRLVAYIAGVTETRAVRQWADGDREMRPDTEVRLREGLTVALTLRKADKPPVVQAWFQGLNPQLDDRSPARLLREGDIESVGPEVRQAARAFVTGG